MRHFLRSIFAFAALLMCSAVSAQKVTLDFTDGANTWGLPSKSSDGVKSGTFTNGTYSIKLTAADNAYYISGGKALFIGKKNSTIELPAMNFKVARIEVVGADGASTSLEASIFVGDKGVSNSVTGGNFTAAFDIKPEYQAAGTVYIYKITSKHNAQIQKINFYEVDENKVNEPVISATSKVFETSTKVSITGDEGTDIYYTLDGTEPTTSSLKYVNEIEVSETSTIKAIAVKGEKVSFVSSLDVNKVTPFTVSKLIEWSSDKTGTVYQDFSTLTLNNAKVLFAIGDLVFLREDGKCIELYKMSGLKNKVETNDILNGTIKGCAESYNSMPEFIESKADADYTDVSALQITKSGVVAEPVVATLAEVINCQHIFDLVKISGVSLKVENKKYSIYKGDEVVALNNVGTVTLPAESEFTKAGQLYDIEGIVSGISSKKGTIYLRAIKAAEATGVEAVSADVETSEAYNLRGVKVAPNTKGIVVINGKKYFNK
ncbi:MAG: chitobiase/beta-hexosaminidase C-terminal domain-containing protein [Bacteroidaceae bacterium]|nr:chitobiase/beta-hexosaminidase C-terminal domain-containing protein [Bacteroidaceae bacterium]